MTDRLKTPIPVFYTGKDKYKATMPPFAPPDDLYLEACKRHQITAALTAKYLRRTYTGEYLSRSEDKTKIYLAHFNQIGVRWVKKAHKIISRLACGYYTDVFCPDILEGVVLCVTRHGDGDGDGTVSGGDQKAKGRVVYLAGTQHSDWDGVTLYTETFGDPEDAARYADRCAEREAETYRKEDEIYRQEQRAEELRDEIKEARTDCLALLRSMRPLRKANPDQFVLFGKPAAPPEPICAALRNQVQEFVETIAGARKELGELT